MKQTPSKPPLPAQAVLQQRSPVSLCTSPPKALFPGPAASQTSSSQQGPRVTEQLKAARLCNGNLSYEPRTKFQLFPLEKRAAGADPAHLSSPGCCQRFQLGPPRGSQPPGSITSAARKPAKQKASEGGNPFLCCRCCFTTSFPIFSLEMRSLLPKHVPRAHQLHCSHYHHAGQCISPAS